MNKNLSYLKQNAQTTIEKSMFLIETANKVLAKRDKALIEKLKPRISSDQNRIIKHEDEIFAWIDKDTDLMWEVKTKENVNNKYLWEDGVQNYHKALNEQNYAGFNDWRVPNTEELETIICQKVYNYLHLKKPLSKTSKPFYWSSNTYGLKAFLINFTNSQYYTMHKTDKYYIRCVRGSNNKWIKVLLNWANEHNIPSLSAIDNDEFLSMTVLNLECLNLTKLPKEIGNFTNLKQLYLYDNNFKTIPSVIVKLQNLTHLLLGKNRLKKLPKVIKNLKNLTYLSIENNYLREIPKEIGNLTNLNQLFLNGNKLQNLPEEITNLKNLNKLYLYDNNFTYLPKQNKTFKNLLWNKLSKFRNSKEQNKIIDWLAILEKSGCEIIIKKA